MLVDRIKKLLLCLINRNIYLFNLNLEDAEIRTCATLQRELGDVYQDWDWDMTATPVSLTRKEDKKTYHLFCLAIKILCRP